MQLKTKKVIAKEGLIILGILILSAVSLFTSNFFNMKVVSRTEKLNIMRDQEVKGTLPENQKLALDEAKRRGLVQLIALDDGSQGYGLIAMRNTKMANKFEATSLYILIFAYPFYWLTQFCIWAIRILRRKEELAA